MRKLVVPVITALALSLLLPLQSAAADTVDPPLATGEIQQIGPGLYFSEAQSFQIAESDVAVGGIGRRHSVVAQAGSVAQPESAPASRADMGAFGPGWEGNSSAAPSIASWNSRTATSWSPTSGSANHSTTT